MVDINIHCELINNLFLLIYLILFDFISNMHPTTKGIAINTIANTGSTLIVFSLAIPYIATLPQTIIGIK